MKDKYLIRIALMGDGAVGKTSLRKRYMGQGFKANHMMTIGADFAIQNTSIEHNGSKRNVTFQIWDLAGQTSFAKVRQRFFQGAMGGVCVFDITRKDSFNNVTKWIDELWRNSGRGVVPVIILGNKSDIRSNESVSNELVRKYTTKLTENTKKMGFEVYYLETSAKTGLNVEKAFEIIGRQIIYLIDKGKITSKLSQT